MKQDRVSQSEELVFRFKQFDVRNSQSAMKVNTDGVMLGAWAGVDCEPSEIWDVGCGTGVIGLMLAQRYPSAHVTCVDIDPRAAHEALANVKSSPWRDRMDVMAGDIFDLAETMTRPQMIVSNPPYFSDSAYQLRSPERRKAMARHGEGLSFDTLIDMGASRLADGGSLCVVAPAELAESIEWSAALSRLSVAERMMVSTKEGKAPRRSLWRLKKGSVHTLVSYMNIRDARGCYTDEYRRLVKDFYIKL